MLSEIIHCLFISDVTGLLSLFPSQPPTFSGMDNSVLCGVKQYHSLLVYSEFSGFHLSGSKKLSVLKVDYYYAVTPLYPLKILFILIKSS